jgi:hypothetical protein
MMKFTVALLIPIMLSLAGCSDGRAQKPNGPFSFHTTPGATEMQRIAVLPFTLGSRVGRSAQAIDASMAASLRELGYHEVVAVTPETRSELLAGDVLYVDNVTTTQLMRLRQALNVDAVVIGRVEQFDGFDPLSIGLAAHLVSCRDGSVLWSMTGNFDAHKSDIQNDIRRWYESTMSGDRNSVGGWRLALQSPTLFTRYVTDRVVTSLPMQGSGKKN